MKQTLRELVGAKVAIENHAYEMAKREEIKPHQFESVTVSVHHRPDTVIAVVRKNDDDLPIGVGHAFRNPRVKAQFDNLERIALRRAFHNAKPLLRLI